jgi:hypothetical protein
MVDLAKMPLATLFFILYPWYNYLWSMPTAPLFLRLY